MTVLVVSDHAGLRPRAAALDVDAEFTAFVAAQGPGLVRLARGLLRDPTTAEDVVQDVLATVLLKWSRVNAADNREAYVRRMVVNACTSFFRRAARRERAADPVDLPEGPAPGASGGSTTVADHAQQVAERDRMLAALRRLPAKQRAVLVLRHYEGMSDAEIADLLGTREVTVRSNAHRGLATLRTLLAEGVR